MQPMHATLIVVPWSRMKENLAKVFVSEGFLAQYVVEEKKPQSDLKIFLKYRANGKPLIHKLRRISSPGGRVYAGYKNVKPFLKGMGIRILSTPKGILTDKQARTEKTGGELLCEVW